MVVSTIYKNNVIENTKPVTGKITLGGHSFDYEYYLFPLIGANKEIVEKSLIHRFGNRIQNGEKCLHIEESAVTRNMKHNEYSSMIFVKNRRYEDSASCSLQLYDWCNTGKDQIWINDLCRIASEKQTISPVKILFKVVEMIIKKYTLRLNFMNLMVDNEKVDSTQILISIYQKYGFEVIPEQKCSMNNGKYTLMRRRIKNPKSTKRVRFTIQKSTPRYK